MNSEPFYPIGIQDFEEIRRRQAVYVDKTALVYRLVTTSKYVFLNRPRRFGKSLLSSTLQYYYEGRKDLFEGLAIESLERDWIAYPVLHFDLSKAKNNSLEGVKSAISLQLDDYESLYGKNESETTLGARLSGVVRRAYEKTGRQAVVLIDEYDAPILDVLHEGRALEEVRRVMQEFYTPLKSCDRYLQFVFITGITKFSQLSIFSTLNNLENISMSDTYAAICGITEEELHLYFDGVMPLLAESLNCSVEEAYVKLKAQYDGYHFSDKLVDVYNPFSLLSALKAKKLMQFWFATATPTYLFRQMDRFPMRMEDLESKLLSAEEFDVPTEGMTNLYPLLYQSGYITIQSYDPVLNAYQLGYPNMEVRAGLTRLILARMTYSNTAINNSFSLNFCSALLNERVNEAMKLLRSYLAGIPYPEGGKRVLEELESSEYYYEQLFYVLFSSMNGSISTQVKSCRGRADLLIRTPQLVYLIELKLNHSAREALDQINDRGYAIPYEAGNAKIIKVGVNFSTQTRTVEDWLVEVDGVVQEH
jgi:hypothetical protein